MKRIITFIVVVLAFVLFYNWRLIYDAVQMQTANSLYAAGKYIEAKEKYEKIIAVRGSSLLSPLLHNLGNTLYRIGETETGSTNKTTTWQESLNAYKKALSFKKDQETIANYEFVRKKLEEMKKDENKKEQEKQQQEEKKRQDEQKKKDEKTGSGSQQKQNQNSKNEEKKDMPGKEGTPKKDSKEGSGTQSSTRPWTNQGSYNSVGGQNKDNAQTSLSESERQEIESYIQSLRDFQKQNGKFLTPDGLGNKGGSISDQIDSFFRNDPFFRDVLPSSDPTKKDW